MGQGQSVSLGCAGSRRPRRMPNILSSRCSGRNVTPSDVLSDVFFDGEEDTEGHNTSGLASTSFSNNRDDAFDGFDAGDDDALTDGEELTDNEDEGEDDEDEGMLFQHDDHDGIVPARTPTSTSTSTPSRIRRGLQHLTKSMPSGLHKAGKRAAGTVKTTTIAPNGTTITSTGSPRTTSKTTESARQRRRSRHRSRIDVLMHSDVMERIFYFLDVHSLSQATQVCRALSQVRWPVVDLRRQPHVTATALSYVMTRRPRVLVLSNTKQAGALLAPTVIGCPTLNRIALRGCGLGPAGAEHIALGLVSLYRSVTSLDLSANELGDAGMAVVAASLATNRTIRVMDLSENEITEAGAAALGGALKKNTALEVLRLSENALGPVGIKHIVNGLVQNADTALKYLDISENDLDVQGAKSLEELFRGNSTLTHVNAEDNDLDSSGAEHIWAGLQANRSVTSLELGCNHISGEGLAGLKLALKKNKTLKNLSLRDNPLGDSGARLISKCLENNATQLENIDLSFTGIRHSGAFSLAHALETNTVLRRLSLRFCKLNDAGASCLGAALQKNTSLEDLDLEDCNIRAAGAVQLGLCLSNNRGLRVMSLRCNSIEDAGAIGLAGGLKHNTTLRSLDLAAKTPPPQQQPSRRRSNSQSGVISEKGARILSDALKVNQSLSFLQLQGNSVEKQHYLLFVGSRCHVRLVPGEPGLIASRVRTVTV